MASDTSPRGAYPPVLYCPACDAQDDLPDQGQARDQWIQHRCLSCGTRFAVLRADLLARQKADYPASEQP